MVLGHVLSKIKRSLSTQAPEAKNSQVETTLLLEPAANQPIEIGFAIHIEGALLNGSQFMPTAKETVYYLDKKNYPYVLLADGTSGMTEIEMAAKLCAGIGEEVSSKDIVFPYTAFQQTLERLYEFKEENVLVIGDPINKIKAIAQSYGFQNAYTPADLHQVRKTREIKIGAIFVFNTPKYQDHDICLVKNLLLSRAGWLGTVSPLNGIKELPNRGYGQDEQPYLFWCDNEVMRGTSHDMSKSAQFKFKSTFEDAWNVITTNAAILNAKTEHIFPFIEKKLFMDLKTPTTKIVYLIGNETNTRSLTQVRNYRSLRNIDWRSLMVGGTQLGGNFPPGVVRVKDVGVGVFWASRDARVRPSKPVLSNPPDYNKELPEFPNTNEIDWIRARTQVRTRVAARLRAGELSTEPQKLLYTQEANSS